MNIIGPDENQCKRGDEEEKENIFRADPSFFTNEPAYKGKSQDGDGNHSQILATAPEIFAARFAAEQLN